MDSKQIVDEAKTYVDAIFEAGFSKAEVYMIVCLIDKMCDERLTSKIVVKQVAEDTPTKHKRGRALTNKPDRSKKKKPSGIKYDPYSDPEPPYVPDPVPPRPEATGSGIIARAGKACICSKCSTIIYSIVKDIPDNCPVDEFIESYAPFSDKIEPMDNSVEIENIDGNISTDCPSCGANKAVLIAGKTMSR